MPSHSFRCKDIGMDCGFEARSDSKDSLMEKIVSHAKEAHNMHTIPPDIAGKVQAAIKSE